MNNLKDRYEQRLKEIKTNGLYGANKKNTAITIEFVEDHEIGYCIGGNKGGRSPATLIKLIGRLSALSHLVEQEYGKEKELLDITHVEAHKLFHKISEGTITGKTNKQITDISSLVKAYRQLFNWHNRKRRREGLTPIINPLEDVSTDNQRKPGWVYLTQEQIETLIRSCNTKYAAMAQITIDTGIRPQEIRKLRVKDVTIQEGEWIININEEITKTFERKVKLFTRGQKLLELHIREQQLQPEDLLFDVSIEAISSYYKKRIVECLGDFMTPARAKTSSITLYDLRHNSVCIHSRNPRLNTEQLKYIFGWKKDDKIVYYHEFIGINDDRSETDLLEPELKTKLEKRLEEVERQHEKLEDALSVIQLWAKYTKGYSGRASNEEKNCPVRDSNPSPRLERAE